MLTLCSSLGKEMTLHPQQPSIAFRRGEEDSCSEGALCYYEVSKRRKVCFGFVFAW